MSAYESAREVSSFIGTRVLLHPPYSDRKRSVAKYPRDGEHERAANGCRRTPDTPRGHFPSFEERADDPTLGAPADDARPPQQERESSLGIKLIGSSVRAVNEVDTTRSSENDRLRAD